jgi:hypothetical protein
MKQEPNSDCLQDYEHPSRVSSAILDMIENSPDLTELELDLSDPNQPGLEPCWQPSGLLRTLKNPLHQLRHLRMGGNASIDWSELIDGSFENTLFSFFEQHNQLRGIHFDWAHMHQPDVHLKPALMSHVFPSLEYFTGPITICTALVASKLAEQLKSLTVILEEHDHPLDYDFNLIEALVDASVCLPSLRELEFVDYNFESAESRSDLLDASTLSTMLMMTPALVTLRLNFFSFDWVSTNFN